MKAKFTPSQRTAEIKKLRDQLDSGNRYTVKELASIRGRIGGLAGAEHPGRRLGGIRAAQARWGLGKKKPQTKENAMATAKTKKVAKPAAKAPAKKAAVKAPAKKAAAKKSK
jgi:DNA-binding protein HU-beta